RSNNPHSAPYRIGDSCGAQCLRTLLTAVVGDLTHTLITFFLRAFPAARDQKMWFIYPKIAVRQS
ncbi:MAG: hypothetical protein ACKPFD_03860, partial [Dolichospermum sp.]